MKYDDHILEFLLDALSEECRAEIDHAHNALALLAHTASPVAPPARLRAQILEKVKTRVVEDVTNGGETTRTKDDERTDEEGRHARDVRPAVMPGAIIMPLRLLTGGFVAASVLIVALLAGLFIFANQRAALRAERDQVRGELARERVATELLTQAESRIAALNGTSFAPRADGRVAFDRRDGRVAVFVHDLPPAPAGRAYQLWFLTSDARKIPGTVFSADAGGGAVVQANVPAAERGNTAGFAITLEPQGGSTQPTGEIYLATPPAS